MRRSAFIAAVMLVLAAAPARAASTEVRVSGFAFSPATVNITQGDTVTWRFAGPDTNHSATSDAGQAEAWDSDAGVSNPNHPVGDTFSHTFAGTGTFAYFCKIHLTMRGRVVVSAPGEGPASDTTAPRVSALRASVRRRRVTFKLDEAAAVVAKLSGPVRRTLKLDARTGTNVLKLPSRLKPGRYALTLRATDAADNAAAPAKVKFEVPKPR